MEKKLKAFWENRSIHPICARMLNMILVRELAVSCNYQMCECYWKAVCFQNLSEGLESLRLSLKCLMLPTQNLFRLTACTLYRASPYFCGPPPWASAVTWVFMWQSSKMAFSSSHPSLLTRAPLLSSSAPFVLYVFGVSISLWVNVFVFIDP